MDRKKIRQFAFVHSDQPAKNVRVPDGLAAIASRLNPQPSLDTRHRELLTIGDLLIKALAIERDLWRRRSKQRKDIALLKQWKAHQRLVGHLVWEYETAVADYPAAIRRFLKR